MFWHVAFLLAMPVAYVAVLLDRLAGPVAGLREELELVGRVSGVGGLTRDVELLRDMRWEFISPGSIFTRQAIIDTVFAFPFGGVV